MRRVKSMDLSLSACAQQLPRVRAATSKIAAAAAECRFVTGAGVSKWTGSEERVSGFAVGAGAGYCGGGGEGTALRQMSQPLKTPAVRKSRPRRQKPSPSLRPMSLHPM